MIGYKLDHYSDQQIFYFFFPISYYISFETSCGQCTSQVTLFFFPPFCSSMVFVIIFTKLYLNCISGSLIKHQLVTHLTLGIALRGVLDALRKPTDSKVSINFSMSFFHCLLSMFDTFMRFSVRYSLLEQRLWSSFWTGLQNGHNIAIIFCKYLIYVVLIQSLLHLLNELLLGLRLVTLNQMGATILQLIPIVVLLQLLWKMWRYKIKLHFLMHVLCLDLPYKVINHQ